MNNMLLGWSCEQPSFGMCDKESVHEFSRRWVYVAMPTWHVS